MTFTKGLHQDDILLRYATEEERKAFTELDDRHSAILSMRINMWIQAQEEGEHAGYDSDEIRRLFDERIDVRKTEAALNEAGAQIFEYIDKFNARYIEAVKSNISILFEDMETVAASDIDTGRLHDIIIYDIETKKPKTLPDYRVAKQYAETVLHYQVDAFRECENKTKQDTDRYKSIIKALAEKILKQLTPEQRQAIDTAFKCRYEKKSKADLVKPIQPAETFYTPNSYINNNFMEIIKPFYKENDGQMSFIPTVTEVEVDITGKSKGKLPVMLSINYEGDITKAGTKTIDYNKARIEGFDTAVLDAICTILETGQKDIYVSAVDALLRGSDKIQKISDKREERLTLAIRKLGGTRVRLDITNELKGKYKEAFAALDLKEGVLDAAMLEYTGLELTTYAGIKTYVIHVDKMPAIYNYSKAKGEITSFSKYLLDTPERAEKRFITLKLQLLKRITLINKHVMSENTILFESLYRAAGLTEHTDKGKRSRERNTLVNMLKHWEKQDYIKGYKTYYKGKDYVGFKIQPHYIKKDK